MPRIIFLTTLTLWSMGKGHGGPAFTQTIKKYIDEGWEVFLISDEPSNKDYPYLDATHNLVLKPTLFKKYCQIRKLGLIFRWLDHVRMTRTFYREAAHLLADHSKNTVLYAYEIFGVETCRRLAQTFSVPFVTRFQGTILSQFPNTLANRIKRYPHFQALAQLADLVIMTDDGSKGEQVLQVLGNTSTTMFLRNGLDLMAHDIPAKKRDFPRDAFRSALGLTEEETMFLTVSRLVKWKKVERSIDGFAAFCKKGLPGKLVIVGDGENRSVLEQRAKELGIADKVVFTGSVAHDQVYDYMMACDVFLSLYDLSNVGNPLLEAMTLGKCIITLDVGDTKSLIHHRENGILLTKETLSALSDMMIELAETPALRDMLGTAAAADAQVNFQTWEARMDTEFRAVSAILH